MTLEAPQRNMAIKGMPMAITPPVPVPYRACTQGNLGHEGQQMDAWSAPCSIWVGVAAECRQKLTLNTS